MDRPRDPARTAREIPDAPLYDPGSKHDAGGVWFVADTRGRRSQQLVAHARAGRRRGTAGGFRRRGTAAAARCADGNRSGARRA